MASTFLTITKSFGRLTLGFFALCLTLVIIAQVALVGASFWLGTQGGQRWIMNAINEQTAPSGTIVQFSRIGYDAGYGIYVRDLLVANADGSMIEADRARLDVALIPLMARHLSLTATAGTLTIHPALDTDRDEEKQTTELLQGFDLPDLYVTGATINLIAVDELHLRGADDTLVLSPTLQARIIRTDNTLTWRARLTIDQPPNDSIPRLVVAHGAVNTQALSLNLERFVAKAAAYHIDGTLIAAMPLAGKGDATITLHDLRDKGLAPIHLRFDARDSNGHIAIDSAYRDTPVSINSDILLDETTITLSGITADAPELSANGRIVIDRENFLADGQIDIKANDLSPYAALFDTNLRGRGDVSLTLSASDDAQSAAVNAALADIGYNDISVTKLDAQANIPDLARAIPDNLTLDTQGLRLDAQTRFERLQISLAPQDTRYRLTVNGRGQSQIPFTIDASANLHDLLTGAPAARDIDATITARRAALKISGDADMQSLDITARTDGLPLDILPADLPEMVSRLSLSGEARIHGPMDNPVARADIALSPMRLRGDNTDLTLSFSGGYENGQVAIDVRGTGTGIDTLQGRAGFPMTLSLQPFIADIPDTTPLSGTLLADLNTATLAALFLPPDHRIDGALNARAEIGGTLFAPAVNGNIALTQGTYIYEPYGVALNDLTLRASLSDNNVTIDTLSAHDGGNGTIKGGGRYSLSNGNGAFDISLAQYHLFRSDMLDGTLDGSLSIAAASHAFNIGGDLAVGPMEVTIPEQFQSTIPELNIVEEGDASGASNPLEAVKLAVNITANRLFVRGWGLDAEFGGAIGMGGTLADPQFNGAMSAGRGRYEEFGRRFDLAKADMRFQGNIPPSPYLDIEATTNAGDVVASVLLSGPVNNPAIKFASTPALPEDEVLAYILFGRSMSRITPFQAVQLTQTLRRFSGQGGGGGFDPLGTIRSLTGLDDIRVDTDEEGATSVGAGKYLTDNVYLEVESGAGEAGGAATLQIEVTPNITVESEVGQDAQAGGGVFWRYDY